VIEAGNAIRREHRHGPTELAERFLEQIARRHRAARDDLTVGTEKPKRLCGEERAASDSRRPAVDAVDGEVAHDGNSGHEGSLKLLRGSTK
jgi:hypothetical protein